MLVRWLLIMASQLCVLYTIPEQRMLLQKQLIKTKNDLYVWPVSLPYLSGRSPCSKVTTELKLLTFLCSCVWFSHVGTAALESDLSPSCIWDFAAQKKKAPVPQYCTYSVNSTPPPPPLHWQSLMNDELYMAADRKSCTKRVVLKHYQTFPHHLSITHQYCYCQLNLRVQLLRWKLHFCSFFFFYWIFFWFSSYC